ncbi:Uncharacterised protein [Streptococcus pneumoniae]|nr:Uncharacterised protein [Streptococcus pneumoniae]
MKETSFENKASASFIIDPFVLPTSVTITSSRKRNDASLCNSFFVSSTGEAKTIKCASSHARCKSTPISSTTCNSFARSTCSLNISYPVIVTSCSFLIANAREPPIKPVPINTTFLRICLISRLIFFIFKVLF